MCKVVMDEMKGLFCVDILVTLEIFPNKAVPSYALYNEEGLVQMCLFLVPGQDRIWLLRLTAFCNS